MAGLKGFALKAVGAMLALGAATLALAPFTGHYRGFYLALTLGGIVVFVSGVYIPLIMAKRDDDTRGIAVSAIQSLWVSTSMGLGYVVTALAPYFKIVAPVAYTLFAIGWVMLLFGLYSLVKVSRESGVPLAV